MLIRIGVNAEVRVECNLGKKRKTITHLEEEPNIA